jgi:hypothetical protein
MQRLRIQGQGSYGFDWALCCIPSPAVAAAHLRATLTLNGGCRPPLSRWSTHRGHFVLTNLLLPHITDRVVTISSPLQGLATRVMAQDAEHGALPTLYAA